MRAVPLVLTLTVLTLAGCGGDDQPDSAGEGCAILASGNKLCGQDLNAYCTKFAAGSTDPDTSRACAQVDPTPATDTTGGRGSRRDRDEYEQCVQDYENPKDPANYEPGTCVPPGR